MILLLGGLFSAGIYVITDTAAKENLFLTVPTAIILMIAVFLLLAIFSVIIIVVACSVFLIISSFVAFSTNVIQFGTDQLHDAPTDDSVLYIHWYIWTSYAGIVVIFVPLVYFIDDVLITFSCIVLLAICTLGATLCIQRYKLHWFFIDSGSRNPYKLVYKVLKFAKDHTSPIRRSAFTYCADELPSRLDLGKEKYGGPFTTEQVEDVKAFFGILRILLTTGPVLIVDFAASGFLHDFAYHMDYDFNVQQNDSSTYSADYWLKSTFYYSSNLTPLLIIFLIPLYLCILRPFIYNYIPGMLKRIGLGMIIVLLSALCTLSVDAYGHVHTSPDATCFLMDETVDITVDLNISSHFLISKTF